MTARDRNDWKDYGGPSNTSTVSSTNTALTVTLTPATGQKVRLYSVEAFSSAGTASFTLESPSGTVVYRGATDGVTTTPWFLEPTTPQEFRVGDAVLFKTTAAGASNTTTINVQAGVV